MVTAALAILVLWSLFAGALNAAPLAALCLAAGVFLLLNRHSHSGVLVMDVLCRKSRYCSVNAALKVVSVLVLLVLGVLSQSAWVSCALFLVMSCLTVAGGVHLHDYLSVLTLPLVFLLLGALAILWGFGSEHIGVVNVPLFGGYLLLTTATQATARLVLARALGAVSCLFFLSLSTPMTEILAVLEGAHVPGVLIDLAVLIYRYIFLMLDTYQDMRSGAESRLGFVGFRGSLRTTGLVYGGLLGRSFRRAGDCLAAMESRCYSEGIRFLHPKKPLRPGHALLFATLILATLVSVAATWR
jgi:cobalt/nickel transport system permease protein